MILEASALREAKAILETPVLLVLKETKETKENKALAVHKSHRGIRVALSVMSEHRDHRVGHRVVVLDVLVDRDRVLEAWPTWGTERW